ncbi:DUF5305 domain-containing protein [Natrialbaceae archaeon A-arb3/5]
MISPHFRSVVSANFVLILGVLLALSVIGGVLAYGAHATTETSTEERTVGTWETDATFEHGATVENDTAVFEAGDRLENRPSYFTAATPELEGEYVLSHRGTDGEPATATTDLTLVTRAVEDSDEGEVVHWEETDSLATLEAAELADGDAERLSFAVDVRTITARIAEIEADLEATPGTTEILIQAETTIDGTLAGESTTISREDVLELEESGNVYTVTSETDDAPPREVTETVTTTEEPSTLSAYGSLALLFGSLSTAVGLVYARRSGALAIDPEERSRYEFRAARSDLDEWISPGDVPEDDDRTVVRVRALADVVDVAIDCNRRVLETDDGRYVVLAPDVRYVFQPARCIRAERETVDADDRGSRPVSIPPTDPADESGGTAHERHPSADGSGGD